VKNVSVIKRGVHISIRNLIIYLNASNIPNAVSETISEISFLYTNTFHDYDILQEESVITLSLIKNPVKKLLKLCVS